MARVIIVGAGVLGTMHAYLALNAGHEVLLLEREAAARGASVRNFGLIWISGRRPGEELEFALRSRALWEKLARDVPELGFRANGSLTIAQDERELHVLEQVAARGDATDRRVALLGADEVRAVNPAIRGSVLAGLHCTADAAVEPWQVPAALRRAMEENPRYRFVSGRHVVEAGEGFVVDHTGRRHEGDLVYLCPGAAHRGIAGWDADPGSLRRVRLQMMQTEPFSLEVTTSVADGDSLRYYPAFEVPALADLRRPAEIVAEQHMQLLLQQRLDGSLTIGDTHEYEEPFDVAVSEAPYRHLLERAESILGTRLPPVARRWAGVYSQALDERLYHSEELADTTWLVTGAGGRGMTLAPAIAEEVLAASGALQRTTASSTAR